MVKKITDIPSILLNKALKANLDSPDFEPLQRDATKKDKETLRYKSPKAILVP